MIEISKKKKSSPAYASSSTEKKNIGINSAFTHSLLQCKDLDH